MMIGDVVVVKDQPEYQYPIEGGVLVDVQDKVGVVNDGINMDVYYLDKLRVFEHRDNTLVGQYLFVSKTIKEHPNVQSKV